MKMYTTVAINTDFGGFGISDECYDIYKRKTGKRYVTDSNIESRADPNLIEAIKECMRDGKPFGDHLSKITLVEVPSVLFPDYCWLDEIDGMEILRVQDQEYKINQIRSLPDLPTEIKDIINTELYVRYL